jgi:CBS domain-containing protein
VAGVVTNIISCPYCGADVIRGSDDCDNCGQSLVGLLITETALNISESHFSVPISAIRLSRPVVVSTGVSLREAIDAMKGDAAGAAVIVDGRRVAGIITDRDILRRVAAGSASLDEPVTAYMTPDPVVLRDDDTMATALHKMGAGGFRHIPLTRDGELVAMVTARDIVTWLLARYFDD